MRNRTLTALGGVILALMAVVAPPHPVATAAPAPWQWVRVFSDIAVAPNAYYSIPVYCPAGYTAITGGLELPTLSRLQRNAEYRLEDSGGSAWFVSFENFSGSSGTARVVAECARTSDLPAISHNYAEFTATGNQVWSGSVNCLNPGEVVLTGGVDWSNVNTRYLWASGPLWSGEGWQAFGRNSVAGAKMGVEVYCVDPSQVPGYTRVEQTQIGVSNWETTVTCPLGTRILNGGTEEGYANASYPHLNTWTATGQYSERTFVRAWCVSAGSPTIAFNSPLPTLTDAEYQSFAFIGNDPAGFPTSFRCSLDGSSPTGCPGLYWVGPLSSGSHQLVVFNQTADGRQSAVLTHQWTVDLDPPSVSAPRLAQVTLADGEIARWAASDAVAGIDHHEAKYWRGRANGVTVDWTQPASWADLDSPLVRVPAMAAGDTLCLSVRAVDNVGHTSAWTTPRCTSRPYDDADLTASPGWTRVSNAAYWNGTMTRTGVLDETLHGPSAKSRQLGLLASVCPGCGSVVVKIGSTTIGSVSLDQPTSRNKQVLLLPAFAEKTGVLTLTSATSGKSIRIDGLVTIRRPAAGPPW
ncbi:hypothetical protein F0U44_10165 [Nocardioides humilatus]|uniref:Ig-like domain-containing protein n=1 Tax=Nocardioides humilatus TaxID=2607660 RepID=A0A5B1LGC9_9ACTN|nr:hypothetical protein [Nocardioides humilatus]KAA1418840.1 hypothetical protein F0U44_10165 [Nocardioides humilatus]